MTNVGVNGNGNANVNKIGKRAIQLYFLPTCSHSYDFVQLYHNLIFLWAFFSQKNKQMNIHQLSRPTFQKKKKKKNYPVPKQLSTVYFTI